MAKSVARSVDPRSLAIPDTEHPVVAPVAAQLGLRLPTKAEWLAAASRESVQGLLSKPREWTEEGWVGTRLRNGKPGCMSTGRAGKAGIRLVWTEQ